MINSNGNLVLCRRLGESIMIGDDIEVKISRLKKGQVSLAVHAPKEIDIHRKEIWERIQVEKQPIKEHVE